MVPRDAFKLNKETEYRWVKFRYACVVAVWGLLFGLAVFFGKGSEEMLSKIVGVGSFALALSMTVLARRLHRKATKLDRIIKKLIKKKIKPVTPET